MGLQTHGKSVLGRSGGFEGPNWSARGADPRGFLPMAPWSQL